MSEDILSRRITILRRVCEKNVVKPSSDAQGQRDLAGQETGRAFAVP
ncbi:MULTISPECIES: hypothetical protein [unclassified Aliiroseovarius]|nr:MULTISPECIES: hypothetical protein [unclassified Aliiroseovarius]